MRLISLKLQDFQGLRHYVLEADGKSVSVYGTNGTGKTTIANSISWVLFDKPYTGEKNYSPKTTDADGKELHHLDHRAEAVFQRDDGSRIAMTRVFHEVWKKKRGSSTEEFSGHVVDNYIDGVPVSAGEYKRTLEDICPPDRAKILTDPRYFARTIHWEERRQILLEMCGDVTDADVIASDPELTGLWEYLRKPGAEDQFYTVQEFQRIAASRKAELNRELTILPARIDETLKSIPETGGLPPEETIRDRVAQLERQKMDLMGRAGAMTADEQAQVLRRQAAELQAKLAEARAAHIQLWNEKNREVNQTIQEQGKAGAAAGAEAAMLEQSIRTLEADVRRMEADREELLRRHAEVKAMVWEGETVCAACGQPLPPEKLDEAREKFNQQRSRKLAEINEQGQKCSKTLITGKQEELERARMALEDAIHRREEAEAAVREAGERLLAPPPFEETAEYAALTAQEAHVRALIADGSTDMDRRKAAIQAEIDAITEQINQAQDARMVYVTARKRRERLAELEEQEKTAAREYERFDRGVFLCEAFTRAKVAMLDERINRRFQAVRFRLFKQQINGGLVDCCDVLCPTSSGLTPYDSANNAAQVQAGAEIAAALGEHWGVTMPMIVDNAESIVGPIRTGAQTIRLVVSEQDERLRTEYDDKDEDRLGVA